MFQYFSRRRIRSSETENAATGIWFCPDGNHSNYSGRMYHNKQGNDKHDSNKRITGFIIAVGSMCE